MKDPFSGRYELSGLTGELGRKRATPARSLGQRSDVHLPLPRAVELAKEDPLPAAEGESPVVERDEHLRTDQRGTDVRRRVRPVRVRVTPAAVVVHDALHRRLDVLGERRIGVLVDRHAGGRVRDIDEGGGRAIRRVERRLHLLRDLEQLRLALGRQADLAHPVILRPVPNASPTPQDLDAYRDDADRFIAELDEEYYLHYAGLKDRLELEAIYERHADLTELERAQSLGAAVDGDRGVRELWHFACEGYVGKLTRGHAERLAALEAELEVTVDGEK